MIDLSRCLTFCVHSFQASKLDGITAGYSADRSREATCLDYVRCNMQYYTGTQSGLGLAQACHSYTQLTSVLSMFVN